MAILLNGHLVIIEWLANVRHFNFDEFDIFRQTNKKLYAILNKAKSIVDEYRPDRGDALTYGRSMLLAYGQSQFHLSLDVNQLFLQFVFAFWFPILPFVQRLANRLSQMYFILQQLDSCWADFVLF